MDRFRQSLRPLFVLAVLAGPAMGQRLLFKVNGTAGNPVEYGVVVGDWNGDGTDDLALMWRFDDTAAMDAGAVRIHSGKDGSVLQTLFGTNREDYFGIPVALPDIDGDGVDDLLVMDPWSDFGGRDRGSAHLFAGGSGTQAWRVDGTANFLGIEGGPVRDLDGDGVTDVFVTELGALRVLSGPTGNQIFSIAGSAVDEFGICAIVVGDADGDGLDDFLVGAPETDGAGFMRGEATLFSGADQSVLHTIVGTTDFEQVGEDCARVGDLDGDGLRDYAVLSKHEDFFAGGADPIVRIYSLATNALLGEVRSPDPKRYFLFPRIELTGDVNGDGVEDFTILAGTTDGAGNGIWAPLLFSGRTLALLYSFEQREPHGIVIGGAGDFNGDGLGDMVAGMVGLGGRVRVYGGNDLWLNITPHDPAPNTTLSFVMREGVASNLVVLAIVAVDGTPAFTLVDGLNQFDATGTWSVAGTVPPGLSGHEFTFRSFADDAHGRVMNSERETVLFR